MTNAKVVNLLEKYIGTNFYDSGRSKVVLFLFACICINTESTLSLLNQELYKRHHLQAGNRNHRLKENIPYVHKIHIGVLYVYPNYLGYISSEQEDK